MLGEDVGQIKKYSHGIVTTKAQPFHLGIDNLVRNAISECTLVTVFITGVQKYRTIDNPFFYQERLDMIEKILWSHYPKLDVLPMPDIYNPKLLPEVLIGYAEGVRVAKVDTFYCSEPNDARNWDKLVTVRYFPKFKEISATKIRNLFREKDLSWATMVHKNNLRDISQVFYGKLR
jgi:nicotinamide mononucleotide adenylyltransferase